MSNSPEQKKLPVSPSLEHLKKQAKRLVKQTPGVNLATAQHRLAQDYGCKNWTELVRKVEESSDSREKIVLKRFVDAQRLALDGKPAEALSGITWCIDQGLEDAPRLVGSLLTVLVSLGKYYPPAVDALRERRDKIKAAASAAATALGQRFPGVAPQHTAALQRFHDAQRLSGEGDLERALKEMIWCFETGMKGIPELAGVRASFLLGAIVRLGKRYPPALEALRERRDKIFSILETADGDASDWPDFVAINQHLGENSLTLAFYDQSKGARATPLSSGHIFRQLLEAQRYTEAVTANPIEKFRGRFEEYQSSIVLRPEVPQATHVKLLASISGQQMEALAGAGDLVNAHWVVTRMLQVDKSPATLSTLNVHAARSGHPELIPTH
jgi:hypothetical protein